MFKGTVKWFDPKKGYGFIQLESGQDVFVHHSEIVGQGFKVLREGEKVGLDTEKTSRGFKAVKVARILDVKNDGPRELIRK